MTRRISSLNPGTSNRQSTLAAVAVISLLLSLLVQAPALAVQGAQADYRLPGLRGGELSAADLAHGTTIVVVWASWSPRCRDIVARVNRLAEGWGGRARVVTVDFQEERGAVEEFLSGQSLRPPVYLDLDGSFSKHHEIVSLPGLLVVRDGVVAYHGKLPADPDSLLSETLR